MDRSGRRARTIQDDSRVSWRLRDGLRRYQASVPARSIRGLTVQPTLSPPPSSVFADLAGRAFELHRGAIEGALRDIVVTPSVPILYFGDRASYTISPCRIVTVALNPSKAEFPSDGVFSRFPLAANSDGPNESYFAALDAYFETRPYVRWFSAFEAVLSGLDASYYAGSTNRVLHTDLCSPLATNPSWSRIGSRARSTLMEGGVPLWHQLIELLEPDIVLISVARQHLDRIEFDMEAPFEISRLEEGHRRPYVTEGRWMTLGGGRRSLLVFGPAANQPFGLVSHMHKTGIGGRIAAQQRRVDS